MKKNMKVGERGVAFISMVNMQSHRKLLRVFKDAQFLGAFRLSGCAGSL